MPATAGMQLGKHCVHFQLDSLLNFLVHLFIALVSLVALMEVIADVAALLVQHLKLRLVVDVDACNGHKPVYIYF